MRLNGPRAAVGLRNRRGIFLLALTFLGLAGCGSALYEERLAKTRLLFAHIDHLNDNLQARWVDPQSGASLRVPMQFAVLPPPAKPEPVPGEDPKEVEDPPDERQPKYLNVELPGLRGAFEAGVKVLGDNNVVVDDKAWIYVLTNHDLYESPEQAKSFNQDVVKKLAKALDMAAPEAEKFETVNFPSKQGSFVKPVKYTTVSLIPEADILGLARQFTFYMYEQGEVRLTILFVLPQSADSTEKLIERTGLCLETLELTSDRLSAPGPGGAIAPPNGAAF